MSTPTAPRPLSLADQLAAGGMDPATARSPVKDAKAARERRLLGRRRPAPAAINPHEPRDADVPSHGSALAPAAAEVAAPLPGEPVEHCSTAPDAAAADEIEILPAEVVAREDLLAGDVDAVPLPAAGERFAPTVVIDTAAIDARDTLETQRDLRAALAAQMERDRKAQAARDEELARERARAERATREAAARREAANTAARQAARRTWGAATRDLAGTVQAARDLLASAPEGIDADDRQAVTDALHEADEIGDPGDDVDELTAACTRVLAARAGVSSATVPLARAVSLWEWTEDQRRAAEREQQKADEDGSVVVEAQPASRAAQTVVLHALEARPVWRRWQVLVALALVAVVGAGGAMGWRAYTSNAASARAEWAEERMTLTGQIQGAERVLEDSETKVADEAVRTQLGDAIEAAVQARRVPDEDESTIAPSQWRQATRDVIAAGAVLDVASRAVTEAQQAWQLQQAAVAWQGARDTLGAALDDAAAVLAASAGQVADDAVRLSLQGPIETATEVNGREVDDQDLDALTTARSDATDATETLAGPVQAVRDAQGAWVEEQDRAAADQANAAAAAAAADRAATRSGTQAPAQQPAAAPAAPTTSQGGGTTRELWIRPGSVGCTSAAPNDFSVSASTGGISGPVVVTIGGRSLQIGTGSGSFSGTFEALPAGTYPWSVSADGLVVPGGKSVVVPCPQS